MNIQFEESKKIQDIKVEEEKLTIIFEDGEIISYATEHDQHCCEHVYGDFSIFKYNKEELLNEKIKEIELVKVEGEGFLLRFNKDYSSSTKVFIPCYDFQNGYYSSNLKLQITRGETKTEIDITNLVSAHYE